MSVLGSLTKKLQLMGNIPDGVNFNPVAVLDRVAEVLLGLHGAAKALQAERRMFRQALCGYAWDYGVLVARLGAASDRYYEPSIHDVAEAEKLLALQPVVLSWAPDPDELEPAEKPEKKLIVEPGKGLVTLH